MVGWGAGIGTGTSALNTSGQRLKSHGGAFLSVTRGCQLEEAGQVAFFTLRSLPLLRRKRKKPWREGSCNFLSPPPASRPPSSFPRLCLLSWAPSSGGLSEPLCFLLLLRTLTTCLFSSTVQRSFLPLSFALPSTSSPCNCPCPPLALTLCHTFLFPSFT